MHTPGPEGTQLLYHSANLKRLEISKSGVSLALSVNEQKEAKVSCSKRGIQEFISTDPKLTISYKVGNVIHQKDG